MLFTETVPVADFTAPRDLAAFAAGFREALPVFDVLLEDFAAFEADLPPAFFAVVSDLPPLFAPLFTIVDLPAAVALVLRPVASWPDRFTFAFRRSAFL